MDQSWKSILEEVSKNIQPNYFKTFISPLKLVTINGRELIVSAPSQTIKSHIEAKYSNFLESAAYQVIGDNLKLTVITDKQESSDSIKSILESKFDDTSAELNSDYTFETFFVSDSNRLAYTAAQSLIEHPSKFNPVYFFGPVGVGKTHLLHAIGNEIKKREPWKTIRYVSSISFLNEFIFSVRQSNRDGLESFKIKYQSYNVLLFDDIQFLNGGAEKTQEEFFALFNFLYERKRQIVIASDRPSEELPLHDRLKSRFVHGIRADLKEHDRTLRSEMFKHYSMVYDIPMSNELLSWLADHSSGDSRALLGIMNDLVLYKKAYNLFLLSEETIKEIANTRLQLNRKRIGYDPDQVIELVCQKMSIGRSDLLGKSRKADFIIPRHLCMLLLFEVFSLKKAHIGRIFNAQHTTVIHGIQNISEKLKTDASLNEVYQALRLQIGFQ
ncbi:chromosomal replication initiator protein [Leptospira ryugenii]|uniref:Chromosomal replication initiator protein DnaA n=1 Tax=Leptospira ryugenii TaxID=1917863 RepID=A0A2P2E3C7_9LEPT|nr:chromosomal replication initiator protein DnaA [Leptospira ryugenii]GBF51334.1 chromosomal replication initiator protein [Leptospira ryugenii]